MKYQELNKTTTEIEEGKYPRYSPFRINKNIAILMMIGFIFFIMNSCQSKNHDLSTYQKQSTLNSHISGRCRDLTDEEIDKINEEEDMKQDNKKMKELLGIIKIVA